MDTAPLDVLVIEDDFPIQRLLKHIVERLGFECECADDGVDGLAAIRRKNPKVIVLDLLLPRANGFDVLRHLKALTPEVLPRVIVVTAASESTYAGCKEIGLTHGLIRKPIDLEVFCNEVAACHSAHAAVGSA
jgi:DNA-binding response OmpR family regulator